MSNISKLIELNYKEAKDKIAELDDIKITSLRVEGPVSLPVSIKEYLEHYAPSELEINADPG